MLLIKILSLLLPNGKTNKNTTFFPFPQTFFSSLPTITLAKTPIKKRATPPPPPPQKRKGAEKQPVSMGRSGTPPHTGRTI